MSTPVWTWLPGSTDPVLAGHVSLDAAGGKFSYEPFYRQLTGARPLDPMVLRFSSSPSPMRIPGIPGLPGVMLDAMPDGYGEERLKAKHGRELSPLELLELGAGDAAGAIAVCEDIEAKMAWQPHRLADLTAQLELLDDEAPSSRAIRRMDEDEGTSAGGERPKVTIEADGRLWLAKLQARGDAPHLPAREFTVMTMAGEVGIDVPPIRLHHHGRHEVFLIERFDRAGSPKQPERHLFASAHTVLGLKNGALPGDPARSYLVLADRMRRWIRDERGLQDDLGQLWRRMAFNALVGNKDDHPRNHALVHDGHGWRLSKAYDITPLSTFVRSLAMSVLPDGSQDCSPANLLQVAVRFGLQRTDAASWLDDAANHVANHWQQRLRENGVHDSRLRQFEPAFVIAEEIAGTPGMLDNILQELDQASSRRGHRRGGTR